MNVFITGIAGFIGFHLAMRLRARGDHVIGCDHFNTYYDPALKRARAALLAKQGISVIEADIVHTESIEPLIRSQGTTHLVHLAAQAGCRNCHLYTGNYIQSNLVGFTQLMEMCKRFPKMKVVFASSSSVYGLNTKVPFSETDPTEQPASLYAATKKSNELIAFSYHHLYGIPLIGLRFFTVYGPWGRPDMAYFSFTDSIYKGRPITLFNEGNMQRDFTYIDDIIEGTTAALSHESPWDIFNLGNHAPQPVTTLVSLIEKETNKKAHITLLPAEPEEVPITYADITKARTHLNFHPKTSLEEGIHNFVAWYKTYLT